MSKGNEYDRFVVTGPAEGDCEPWPLNVGAKQTPAPEPTVGHITFKPTIKAPSDIDLMAKLEAIEAQLDKLNEKIKLIFGDAVLIDGVWRSL